MRRLVLALALLAVALAAGVASPAALAKVPAGPAGDGFYTPPDPLPGTGHGGAIWARRATGAAHLQRARRTDLVLYRSIGVDGRPTAVSGLVSVPRGKAPKGGWPVITWGHGTVGIADSCAPSRNPTHPYNGYIDPLLNRWLAAGYAIVRTDYEGLGTPPVHPYLVGRSEGRSQLDMVRAARAVEPALGKRVVIAGHSQGGQAALFAASLAKSWTPELQVRGTLAFAPISHLSEQFTFLRGFKDPSGLTAFVGMIARGLELAEPSLQLPSLLSPRATELYPQTLDRCLPDLETPDSLGGLPPAQFFRDDADLAPVQAALDRDDDPENLRIPSPLRLEQGTADTTVLPAFVDQLARELQARGTKLVYRKYPNQTHAGIVVAAAGDATRWLATRLGRDGARRPGRRR